MDLTIYETHGHFGPSNGTCHTKNKTPALKLQNRNNQRLARARHRQYVEDLQQRLLQYQGHEAKATAEMQQAARAVALENKRLRELLACHGVSSEEISAYLGRPVQHGDGASSQDGELGRHAPSWKRAGGHATTEVGSESADDACNSNTMASDRVRVSPFTRGTDISESAEPSDIVSAPSTESHSTADSAPGTSIGRLMSSKLQMSCAAAADIIRDISGQRDSASARKSLGCTGPGDCLVKNTRLFELMDQAT